MASINGVSVKKVKYFVGQEGGCFQADVYLDGKKQGFWSQDSWGGPDNFEFDEDVIESRANDYYRRNPHVDEIALHGKTLDDVDFKNLPRRAPRFETAGLLLEEVVRLNDIEKFWKMQAKEGRPYVVSLDFYHGSWPIPNVKGNICACDTRDEAEAYFAEYLEKYLYAYITIYEKADDFNLK